MCHELDRGGVGVHSRMVKYDTYHRFRPFPPLFDVVNAFQQWYVYMYMDVYTFCRTIITVRKEVLTSIICYYDHDLTFFNCFN